MRQMFDWLMVTQTVMEEWKFVSMDSGAQYVMLVGI